MGANSTTIALRDGQLAQLHTRLAYDGFYNGALAPEEDGSGQKVFKVHITVDGNVIAWADAGYLDERRGGRLSVLNIKVIESWRRQGIATAIYDAVEAHYGDEVCPYPGNVGGAIQHFWINRLAQSPENVERFRENIGPILSPGMG